ncbi:MAG: uroporphyrinogen-III synthase [Candidatus Nanopelagicales bacterium]
MPGRRRGAREWLARLDDPDTRLTTSAERAVLVGVDAACTTAVAAQASIHGSTLRLRAELTVDSRHTDADLSVDLHDDPDPVLAAGALGLRAAGVLRGATPSARPVLLVRAEHDDPDAAALEARRVPVVSDPYLRRVLRPGGDDVERLLATLTAPAPRTWLVVTSPAAMPALADVVGEQRVAAAVATAVRRECAAATEPAQRIRSGPWASSTWLFLVRSTRPRRVCWSCSTVSRPGTVLLPLGGQALRTLPDGLAARGWDVVEAVVYDTEPVAERPASALLLEAGQVAAVVLRSPSAVRARTGHARVSGAVRIVCAGPTTARAATEAGLRVDAVAASPDPAAVAAVVRG